MSNKLVPIPHSDWQKLRDLYKKDWPKYYTGYHTVDNYLQWLNKDPINSKFQLFSLNGDWSDGTYLLVDNNYLFINTCSDDHHRKIYELLSLIDWTKEWDIYGYVDKIYNNIKDFIHSNSLQERRHTESYWYYLPKEEAIKFDIRLPEGFSLKQLTEKNAECVNSLWPYHKDGTINFVKCLIRYNPSVGIFKDSTQELAGWVLRAQIGTLAILQVKEEYKRRGFGSLLVKALAKVLSEMGQDSCATVVPYNTPSMKLFENLGFKALDKLYWSENITIAVNK